jgi:protease I
MAKELDGVRVAFVVANEGIEQAELTEPWQAVTDAGGQPELVAPEPGEAQAFNHLDKAERFKVDKRTSEADPGDYDALVLPGGVANADQLRADRPAVEFVRAMFDAGKPVAVVCHGPWALVEAGVLGGRTITSWPTLQTDIRNAGGRWVDEEVHVDTSGPSTIVSSRKPADLPAFCRNLLEVFSRASSRA